MINSISQPYFYFIRMSIIDLTINLGRVVDLAINRIVLIRIDIAIDFSGLSLS